MNLYVDVFSFPVYIMSSLSSIVFLLSRERGVFYVRVGERVVQSFRRHPLVTTRRALGRVVDDLPRLQPGPLVPLDPDADGKENRRDDEHLHAHLFPVVHLGLGSPVQELDNVLGHLRGRGRGAVLVLDEAVEQDTGHGDTGAGEVGVEVEAGTDLGACRGLVGVAGQQREDVVAATVAGLDDEGQVRRQGTGVGEARGLFVGVRVGQVVRQLAGALLDDALLVGLVIVLVLLGHGLGLVGGQDGADQSAVGHTVERVAGGADLTVDLEATTKTGAGS